MAANSVGFLLEPSQESISRLNILEIGFWPIRVLMGHTSFVTTQRYAHHFVESLRRGVESVEASKEVLTKDVTEMATVN